MTGRSFDLDRLYRPLKATCGKCKGPAALYPIPEPNGALVCPTCSPAWLEGFLRTTLDTRRQNEGLAPMGDHKIDCDCSEEHVQMGAGL